MSKFENLKLDNQLCFALYAATHSLTRAYRSGLESFGLTYTQYLVMLVLWEIDNVRVSKIAERLELDSSTITPLLKRLETAGLIKRVRDKDDERIVKISLTEVGNSLQNELAQVQQGVACKTGLGVKEFQQLTDTLHRLISKMASNEKSTNV